MKKLTIFALALLGWFSTANAGPIQGVNFGVSLQAGVFEVDGASEKFSGAHSGGASPGDVTKKNTEHGDEAEGLFVIPSLFLEARLTDQFSIGVDYVPESLESETAENKQADITTSTTSTDRTNTVQVDFEDLTTIYVMIKPNGSGSGPYIKAGVMSVDVNTNENLGTGGAYGNTNLDGTMLGIGYDMERDNGVFLRAEASLMEMDGVTLTNTNDSAKQITADGISGYGAKVSLGRSF